MFQLPSRHYSRAFAVFGLLYSGSECAIETYRARHDIYNAVGAGCATGAAISYSGVSSIRVTVLLCTLYAAIHVQQLSMVFKNSGIGCCITPGVLTMRS